MSTLASTKAGTVMEFLPCGLPTVSPYRYQRLSSQNAFHRDLIHVFSSRNVSSTPRYPSGRALVVPSAACPQPRWRILRHGDSDLFHSMRSARQELRNNKSDVDVQARGSEAVCRQPQIRLTRILRACVSNAPSPIALRWCLPWHLGDGPEILPIAGRRPSGQLFEAGKRPSLPRCTIDLRCALRLGSKTKSQQASRSRATEGESA